MFCAGCIDLVAQTHPMLDFQLFPNLPGQRCSSVLLNSPYSIPTYEEFPREDPLTSSSRYLYKNRSFVCVLTLSSLPGPPTEPRKKIDIQRPCQTDPTSFKTAKSELLDRAPRCCAWEPNE